MEEQDFVNIYSAKDFVEAELLVEALKNNHITAYRSGNGVGGYMDIYAGNSIYGENIMADRKKAERAKEIIQDIVSEKQEAGAEESSIIGYSKRQIVISRIIAGIMLIIILTVGLYAVGQNLLQ